MDQTPKLQTSAALRFIFITIFIDVMGLAIIIPVIPDLLRELGHVDYAAAVHALNQALAIGPAHE